MESLVIAIVGIGALVVGVAGTYVYQKRSASSALAGAETEAERVVDEARRRVESQELEAERRALERREAAEGELRNERREFGRLRPCRRQVASSRR